MFDNYKDGLHWTSQEELVRGIDTAGNAVFYCIARYPSEDTIIKCHDLLKPLMPPIDIWDEFREAGERGNTGGGWHRFEGKYLEYLETNPEAREAAQQVKAKSQVRPVWLVGNMKRDTHSEAKLLKNYIENKLVLSA